MRRCLALSILLLTTAAIGSAAAQPETRTFSSRQYTIHTDLEGPRLARIAAHMDTVYDDYSRRFSGYPVRNAGPLDLWVFEEAAGYFRFLASQGIDARGSGGMFFVAGPDTNGLATFVQGQTIEQVLGVLRHEGLHQFAYQRVTKDLPIWCNEGTAEWFRHALETERGILPGLADPAAIERMAEHAEERRLITLERLVTLNHATWNAQLRAGTARSLYDQAWSVVHFLTNAQDGRFRPVLDRYLREAWRGLQPGQLRDQVLGGDLRPMEEAYLAYLCDLRPDPLYLGRHTLDALAQAILAARDAEAQAASLDDLKAWLPGSGFEATAVWGSRTREVTGEDLAWLEPPESRRGRRARLVYTRDSRGGPPRVRLTGLRRVMELEWREGRTRPEGTPPYRVVIR